MTLDVPHARGTARWGITTDNTRLGIELGAGTGRGLLYSSRGAIGLSSTRRCTSCMIFRNRTVDSASPVKDANDIIHEIDLQIEQTLSDLLSGQHHAHPKYHDILCQGSLVVTNNAVIYVYILN